MRCCIEAPINGTGTSGSAAPPHDDDSTSTIITTVKTTTTTSTTTPSTTTALTTVSSTTSVKATSVCSQNRILRNNKYIYYVVQVNACLIFKTRPLTSSALLLLQNKECTECRFFKSDWIHIVIASLNSGIIIVEKLIRIQIDTLFNIYFTKNKD